VSALARPTLRILLVDDNRDIHADFRKVLRAGIGGSAELENLEAALFASGSASGKEGSAEDDYELESAYQGQEALQAVERAKREDRPFAMAFVDVRMPPGWDGVETIVRLWEVDPDLQCVICTAFSDYSWSDMLTKLGRTDRLLILKKPFDPMEVCQMANALTRKWISLRRERAQLDLVRRAEQEARSYAVSLETLNKALSASAATAQASLRAKTGLLVHMTNEVLAPMSEILGDERGICSDQEALERVERICSERGELRRLVEDMRDLAEFEAAELKLQKVPVELPELIRSVTTALEPSAQAKGLRLTSAVCSSVPARILSDPKRLGRALHHLVRNAIENTAQGTVRVRAEAKLGATWEDLQVSIAVQDTGRGISREVLRTIFEPFARSSPMRSHGVGVGLSLTRRIAHKLGGELTIDSQPGVSTTFTLRFPCKLVSPGPSSPAS
jgi:signal transduction histidine kinase